jgi:hypothetical protein
VESEWYSLGWLYKKIGPGVGAETQQRRIREDRVAWRETGVARLALDEVGFVVDYGEQEVAQDLEESAKCTLLSHLRA